MPKSSSGPGAVSVRSKFGEGSLTTRIMAGSQENTASGTAYSDDIAGGWCAKNAILADQQLLDAVGSANLGDQLSDLRVPISSISANDQERTFDAFRDRKEDAGNESLAVVFLLEDLDLLPQTGAGAKPRVSHDPLEEALRRNEAVDRNRETCDNEYGPCEGEGEGEGKQQSVQVYRDVACNKGSGTGEMIADIAES